MTVRMCDWENVCACVCARANLAMSQREGGKLEHRGRKGLTDQDRGMTKEKWKCRKTKGMKIY